MGVTASKYSGASSDRHQSNYLPHRILAVTAGSNSPGLIVGGKAFTSSQRSPCAFLSRGSRMHVQRQSPPSASRCRSSSATVSHPRAGNAEWSTSTPNISQHDHISLQGPTPGHHVLDPAPPGRREHGGRRGRSRCFVKAADADCLALADLAVPDRQRRGFLTGPSARRGTWVVRHRSPGCAVCVTRETVTGEKTEGQARCGGRRGGGPVEKFFGRAMRDIIGVVFALTRTARAVTVLKSDEGSVAPAVASVPGKMVVLEECVDGCCLFSAAGDAVETTGTESGRFDAGCLLQRLRPQPKQDGQRCESTSGDVK